MQHSSLESVEAKLGELEVAIKSHRQTMKDLERIALDDDNRIEDVDVNVKLLAHEGNPNDVGNFGNGGEGPGFGSCSASVGIESQANSKVNVSGVLLFILIFIARGSKFSNFESGF